jgi:hypothetical protein
MRLRSSGAVLNSTVTRVPVARSNSCATCDTPLFTAPALNTFRALAGVVVLESISVILYRTKA